MTASDAKSSISPRKKIVTINVLRATTNHGRNFSSTAEKEENKEPTVSRESSPSFIGPKKPPKPILHSPEKRKEALS
jgi:hypothetical protein